MWKSNLNWRDTWHWTIHPVTSSQYLYHSLYRSSTIMFCNPIAVFMASVILRTDADLVFALEMSYANCNVPSIRTIFFCRLLHHSKYLWASHDFHYDFLDKHRPLATDLFARKIWFFPAEDPDLIHNKTLVPSAMFSNSGNAYTKSIFQTIQQRK